METIVQFGPGGRLAGLLSGAPGADGALTLVLPNAGLIPRAGPYRLHVELARRIGPQGNAVFRFDLPGVGEAPRLSDCSDEDAIRAALDCLEQRHGCTRFAVGGICSAADLGWRIAALDPRVQGVLLLDGFSYTGPWFWLARLKLALRRSPRQWPGMIRRRLTRARAPAEEMATESFRDWPTRSAARPQLREMLARKVRLLFVYTGGADDRFLHPRQFSWAFGDASRSDQVELRFWPACDHMFYRRSDRDRLVETVAEWLRPR